MRYDILKTETMESAGRKISSKKKTLSRLQSIAEKLTMSHEDFQES